MPLPSSFRAAARSNPGAVFRALQNSRTFSDTNPNPVIPGENKDPTTGDRSIEAPYVEDEKKINRKGTGAASRDLWT